jgi:hypothetical protein
VKRSPTLQYKPLVLGFGGWGGGVVAEDVEADVGDADQDGGGEGGFDGDRESGEVDQVGDGGDRDSRVGGVLFEVGAEAVVWAADFLLEALFEEGPEGAIAERNSC